MALGAVTMLVVVRIRGIRLPTDRASWRHFAFMGAFASAVPFSLLALSEQHIASATASVLSAATPLFTAVFAASTLGERLRRPQLVGLALGFVGVAVAAGVGGHDLASSSLVGAAAAVGAAAFYGLTFTYARRNLGGVEPMTAAAGQLTMGALLLAPLAIFTSVDHGLHLTLTRVVAIALLGIVGTGLAYPLYYRAIASEGATRASVVTYLVPVVAVAVGVGLLHEEFRMRLVAGAALTMFGIALLHERIGRTRVVPVKL